MTSNQYVDVHRQADQTLRPPSMATFSPPTQRHVLTSMNGGDVDAQSQTVGKLYRPLDETQNEIRLLTLRSGSGEAPIELALECTTLAAAAGDFIAFSYCWGSVEDVAQVRVNDRLVRVRRNLWLFFRSFRNIRRTNHRLWIDFLCINQQDHRERGHQVQLMKKVFSTASKVYAWLGEELPAIDTAIRYIETALSVPRKQRRVIIAAEVRKQGTRALQNLVQCEYWSRLWTIQEIVLAQDLCLLVGDKAIQWEHLQDVTTGALAPNFSGDGKDLRRRDIRNTSSGRNFRQTLEFKRTPNRSRSLFQLLNMFNRALCHDPRDKLYGLLGLVTKDVHSRAIVDYTMHPIEACLTNVPIICELPLQNRGLTFHRMCDVLNWVFGKGNIPVDYDLRSKLKTSLTFEGSSQPYPTSFVPLAACDLVDSEFQGWARLDSSRSYDIYMTLVEKSRHPKSAGGLLATYILYSRVPSQEWEFVLRLDHYPCLFLIVRKNNQSYEVIDVAIEAVPYRDAGESYYLYLPKRVLHPGLVIQARVSDAQYSLLEVETFDSSGTLEVSPFVAEWRVKLNSSALAETIQLLNLTYTGKGVEAPSFLAETPILTNLKLMCPYLFRDGEVLPEPDLQGDTTATPLQSAAAEMIRHMLEPASTSAVGTKSSPRVPNG